MTKGCQSARADLILADAEQIYANASGQTILIGWFFWAKICTIKKHPSYSAQIFVLILTDVVLILSPTLGGGLFVETRQIMTVVMTPILSSFQQGQSRENMVHTSV
jgi:hypothetical protein